MLYFLQRLWINTSLLFLILTKNELPFSNLYIWKSFCNSIVWGNGTSHWCKGKKNHGTTQPQLPKTTSWDECEKPAVMKHLALGKYWKFYHKTPLTDFFAIIYWSKLFGNVRYIHSHTHIYVVVVVQSLSRVWLFSTPGLQHTSLPWPSLSPGVCSTISFSVVPFSSCPQSFPAWGSFPMNQFFPSGGLSIGASAPASVLSMNIQGWFSLELIGLISLLSKGLPRVFSSTTIQKH